MSGLKRSAVVFLMIVATAAAARSSRSTPVAATAQDNLKQARTLIGQGKFAPGLKLVEKAMTEAGNDLETTLELLELQGVGNAALKKAAPAKVAFEKLLSLSPSYEMNRRGPPLAIKAFEEARVAAQPLAIAPAAPDMSTGRISEIALDVTADPHKLAKTIIFNYRVGGGKWKVRAMPAASGRVAAKVDAADKVEWYATVLGANDAEIMRIRNVDSPITHTYQATGPREVVAEDAPRRQEAPRRKEAPKLVPEDKPNDLEVIDSGRRRARWVAPGAVTLIVLGVAAGAVGTYFGVKSSNARKQFAAATAMQDGVVIGLTRRQALGLDSQARGGTIANTLWISAGALVLTGIAIALFGPDEAAP